MNNAGNCCDAKEAEKRRELIGEVCIGKVPARLSDCYDALGTLMAQVGILGERLHPVLMPAEPAVSCGSDEGKIGPQLPPFVRELDEMRQKMSQTIDTLNSILCRLEV